MTAWDVLWYFPGITWAAITVVVVAGIGIGIGISREY